MSPMARPLHSVLMLSLPALFAVAPVAGARNVFDDFSKAPTFTPPAGCMPNEQTYGVVSRCEKVIGPGRTFVALIDTAMGSFGGSPSDHNVDVFVTDHVEDIKRYWQQDYPGKNLVFSSKASSVIPGSAPHGTNCLEYSVFIEMEKAIGAKPVPAVTRLEGLTCAWPVENAAAGKPNIELFWLEAYDEYAPAIGQEPMESFDSTVHDLFASVRLLVPRAFLVPTYAAKDAMRDWTESDVNACFGAGTESDEVAGLARYFYARGDCQLYFMFSNGKVHSVEGFGNVQECWWLVDACERGKDFQEAPLDRWQRWTLGEVALCFGERTANADTFQFQRLTSESKNYPMQMERDGCNMSMDLEKTERLSIFDWSETKKGACRSVLHKCEETLPEKF